MHDAIVARTPRAVHRAMVRGVGREETLPVRPRPTALGTPGTDPDGRDPGPRLPSQAHHADRTNRG